MTNGHDSGGGMGSCSRDGHENEAKPEKLPKAPRPVVSRDDKKVDTVTARASAPGK
jgi:hypothetical protein